MKLEKSCPGHWAALLSPICCVSFPLHVTLMGILGTLAKDVPNVGAPSNFLRKGEGTRGTVGSKRPLDFWALSLSLDTSIYRVCVQVKALRKSNLAIKYFRLSVFQEHGGIALPGPDWLSGAM